MTGIERWALDNNTTAQEIQILTMAENPGNWKEILGPSLDGPEPLPAGRGTALAGLLERGRAGNIAVTTFNIAGCIGCSANHVTENAPDADWADTGDGHACIRSDALPGVLKTAFGIEPQGQPDEPAGNNAPVPETAARPAPKAPAKPKKPAKRGKFAVGKNTLNTMLAPDGQALAVRDMRAFLMSLPGTKPADIALMVDEEVTKAFSDEYRILNAVSGVIVVPAEAYKSLIDLLSETDAWYIPGQADTVQED